MATPVSRIQPRFNYSRFNRSVVLRLTLAAAFLIALALFAQASREGTISVRILDETGRPTPARILLQDSAGVRPLVHGALAVSESAIPIPRQAIAVMFGQDDRAQGYALQPDGSFYAGGAFDVRVPAGRYTVTVTKGNEYRRATETIDLAAGASATREIRLRRWIDMPQRGWYSADDHIHLRRSPADDHAIAQWIAAEDIHVGNLLQMGDFWMVYFSQYAFGDKGRYQEAGRILSPGQEEPRTPEIGHTISLGASDWVRNRADYYSFDKLFDRVHTLGGVTGFAHQGMSFHGYRGMALNTLRGKNDFLELCQFCVPEGPLPTEHYYEFLDLGIKLTALAGSDFPWCGRQVPQIGNTRFYTYLGGPLTFERWFAAVKAGRTFVTTGPILLLRVNGRIPGDTLDIQPGTKLHISVEALTESGPAPVEIVGHSAVLAKGAGNLELDLTPTHGIWIAARSGNSAHTTPVYITVNGGSFRNPATYSQTLARMETYLQEIEHELTSPSTAMDAQATRHRTELERQIAEARSKLNSLR